MREDRGPLRPSAKTRSRGASAPSRAETVLRLEGLHVAYRIGGRWLNAVRDLSMHVRRGETFGLVGESGCGKSTLALSVMGYLGRNGRITAGQVRFLDQDLRGRSQREMQAVRGDRIAMVYQDPRSALNPSLKVGRQIAEVLERHRGAGAAEAWERSLAMLERVHMADPEAVMDRYPHQLSGGMQQRVLIAMALITNPDLLIMDEPTTGLDVTTEAAVLDLVNELKQSFDSAILYITHDLSVIAQVSDRVGVMYAGQLVETGMVTQIFEGPHHPYTLDLLGCVPRVDWPYHVTWLRSIKGRVPLLTHLPRGCVYAPRCRFARARCQEEEPELLEDPHGQAARCFFREEVAQTGITERTHQERAERIAEQQKRARERAPEAGQPTLLSIEHLHKSYGRGGRRYWLFGPRAPRVKAVNGVSLEVGEGETFSLVGESGCGKTTLGRCVVGLLAPTEGELRFRGVDASRPAAGRPEPLRQAMQIVFQNPDSTLNPRHRVGTIIGRPLQRFGVRDRQARREQVLNLLRQVRLDESYVNRKPTQLSGGEKQRVAIARAFAGGPSLVVCDEAVSALDVSVQASILNLLIELRREQQCGYLFISHDLSVVRYLSDRIGVMYLGQLMEIGSVERIFEPPSHPYTEALLSAVQVPDPHAEAEAIRLEGPVPSAIEPPEGCPFHTRCPRRDLLPEGGKVCEREVPPWRKSAAGHSIFCHIPLEQLATRQHSRASSLDAGLNH